MKLLRLLAHNRRYLWVLAFLFWILYNVGSGWHPVIELASVLPASGYVLLLLLFVVVVRWRYKYWPWVGLAVTLLFSLNIVQMYWNDHLVPQPVTSGSAAQVKICTWNTAYFFVRPSTREAALAEWSKNNCDVYMMHEVWLFAAGDPTVERLVKQYFPGYAYVRKGEFVTIVKGDITYVDLPLPEGYLQTTVRIKDQYYDLYNIHIWYPLAARRCAYFAGALNKSCDVIKPFPLRELQARTLQASLATAQNSVLLSGDFNSLPNHYLIKGLQRNYTDIRSAYWWTNATFPSLIPLLRIDYVFTSEDLAKQVTGYAVRCLPQFSDHCWQEVTIKF